MRLMKWSMMVGLLAVYGMTLAAGEMPSAADSYDSFIVINEQNIFSSDRRQPELSDQLGDEIKVTEPQDSVLSIYVLRGIAAESDKANKTIFIEEQISGDSDAVKIGNEILGGVIKDIQLNYILYEKGGLIRRINVGEEIGQAVLIREI